MPTVWTDVAEQHVADLWDGTKSNASIGYFIGQGTGAVAAAKGDTALGAETTEARVATTDTQPAANQNRHVATIVADGTKSITEAGLFDIASGGELYVRGDFTAIPVDAGDSIEFTIDLTWA